MKLWSRKVDTRQVRAIAGSWLERCHRLFEPKSLLALKPRDLAAWHQSLRWTPGPSGKMTGQHREPGRWAVRLYYRWAFSKGSSKGPIEGVRTPGNQANHGRGPRSRDSTPSIAALW